MYKFLEKLKDNKTLCEIYYNDFDKFDVGFVLNVDETWFIFASYKPNGKRDGYMVINADKVNRIVYKSKYIDKITRLMDDRNIVYPFPFTDCNILTLTLNYLKREQKIANIEILDDMSLSINGYVKDIENDYLFIDEVDSYGDVYKSSVIKISAISFIEFDGEEEVLIQKFIKK